MFKMMIVFSLLCNLAFAEQKDLNPAEANLMKTEALRLWQKRDDQQSLEEALSKFQLVHEAHPADLDILTYLTKGHFLLAELHMTNDDLKLKTFEKAREYGEKGLRLNRDYLKYADDDIEKAISKLDAKQVPIIYWTAASLGKWAKLNGIMSSLKYKGQIIALIERVGKLDPDFYYGAVPRYWGGYYAIAPGIAGGDMKKSKKSFEKAMKMGPELLTNKVLYAELYLVEKGDKKQFKKVLKEVLMAPNGPQDIVPENMMEKKKAERLLDKEDDLF